MKNRDLINNQQGMSVATLMIEMTLVVVAAASFADRLVIQTKIARNGEITEEIHLQFDKVRAALDTMEVCQGVISGQPASGSISVFDPTDAQVSIATAGDRYGRGWIMEKVEMRNVAPVEGMGDLVRGTVYLEARKDAKIALGAPIISQEVADVYFLIAQDGRIANCFGESPATYSEWIAQNEQQNEQSQGLGDGNSDGSGNGNEQNVADHNSGPSQNGNSNSSDCTGHPGQSDPQGNAYGHCLNNGVDNGNNGHGNNGQGNAQVPSFSSITPVGYLDQE